MTAVEMTAYLGLVLAIGYVIASMANSQRRMSAAELLGLSLGLGFGTVGLLLLDLSLVGFPPHRGVLLLIGAVATLLLIIMAWGGRLAIPSKVRAFNFRDWTEYLLLLPGGLIVYVLVGVTVHAVAFDMYDGDAFAMWGLKAREVATEPIVPHPEFFSDPALFYSHARYPLLLPFVLAGGYGSVGGFHDRAVKVLFPLMFLALILLCYSCLFNVGLSRLQAFLLTALLVAVRPMARWAGSGYVDVPFAMFYFGSVVCLIRWLGRFRWQDLLLCAMFSAFAALTKNEGLPLAVINGIAIAVGWITKRPKLNDFSWIVYVGTAALMVAPFLTWVYPLPRGDEDYPSKLTISRIIDNRGRLLDIIPAMAGEAMAPRQQGCVWILLIAAAAVGRRGFARSELRCVWFLIGAQLFVYALVYEITPWDLTALLPLTVDRLFLHVTPLAVVLIGLHWRWAGEAGTSAAG